MTGTVTPSTSTSAAGDQRARAKEAAAPPSTPAEATAVDLLNIDARTVILQESGAQKISADRVILRRSGSKTIDATSVELDRSLALVVRGRRAVLNGSRVFLARGDDVSLARSRALVVIAGRVRLDGSHGLVLAGRVEGDGRPAATPGAAFAFGAGFGAIVALVALMARVFVRRR